ncbi:MAG: leucine-rich repeat domain-containing protein, partial [Myxococcota bacterium]
MGDPGLHQRVASHTEVHRVQLELTEVPAELRRRSELRTLSLWDNALTRAPAWLGELVGLRVLNLSCNRLRALPDALGDL